MSIGIDWETIRERGETGMLTARETDALVELGKAAVRTFTGPDDCYVCHQHPIFQMLVHDDDCPICVLEAVESE